MSPAGWPKGKARLSQRKRVRAVTSFGPLDAFGVPYGHSPIAAAAPTGQLFPEWPVDMFVADDDLVSRASDIPARHVGYENGWPDWLVELDVIAQRTAKPSRKVARPMMQNAPSMRDVYPGGVHDGEPSDDDIYNRVGVEGGIAYDTSADEPGSLGENDWRL